jgi:hypothetical protein
LFTHAEPKQEANSIKAKHCEKKENNVLMMSDSTKRIQAQESRGFFHRRTLSIAGEIARRDDLKRFYILRASQEVCP